jgi:hypothetical protein
MKGGRGIRAHIMAKVTPQSTRTLIVAFIPPLRSKPTISFTSLNTRSFNSSTTLQHQTDAGNLGSTQKGLIPVSDPTVYSTCVQRKPSATYLCQGALLRTKCTCTTTSNKIPERTGCYMRSTPSWFHDRRCT